VLEKAAGEETNELAGGETIDVLELITKEDSDKQSGGLLLAVFLGRRVSDVVDELALDSGGDW
jgi:hypothetical protein